MPDTDVELLNRTKVIQERRKSLRLRRRILWIIYGIFLIAGLVLVGLVQNKRLSVDDTLNAYYLSIGAGLVVTSLTFIVINFGFVNLENEQRDEIELATRTLSVILASAGENLTLAETQDDEGKVYGKMISLLDIPNIYRVGSFVPLQFFSEKQNLEQAKWLTVLTKFGKAHPEAKIRIIFGLPPLVSELGVPHPDEDDLERLQTMVSQFRNLKNVEIHYLPPARVPLGLSVFIIETSQGDIGTVGFGLSHFGQLNVVDTGFSTKRIELLQPLKLWFEQNLFEKATSRYRIQDEKTSADKVWKDIRRIYRNDSLSRGAITRTLISGLPIQGYWIAKVDVGLDNGMFIKEVGQFEGQQLGEISATFKSITPDGHETLEYDLLGNFVDDYTVMYRFFIKRPNGGGKIDYGTGIFKIGLDPFWWRMDKRHFQDK